MAPGQGGSVGVVVAARPSGHVVLGLVGEHVAPPRRDPGTAPARRDRRDPLAGEVHGAVDGDRDRPGHRVRGPDGREPAGHERRVERLGARDQHRRAARAVGQDGGVERGRPLAQRPQGRDDGVGRVGDRAGEGERAVAPGADVVPPVVPAGEGVVARRRAGGRPLPQHLRPPRGDGPPPVGLGAADVAQRGQLEGAAQGAGEVVLGEVRPVLGGPALVRRVVDGVRQLVQE